jgi:hypothetical protein
MSARHWSAVPAISAAIEPLAAGRKALPQPEDHEEDGPEARELAWDSQTNGTHPHGAARGVIHGGQI